MKNITTTANQNSIVLYHGYDASFSSAGKCIISLCQVVERTVSLLLAGVLRLTMTMTAIENMKNIPARLKTLKSPNIPKNCLIKTIMSAGIAINIAVIAAAGVVRFQKIARKNSAINGDIIIAQLS